MPLMLCVIYYFGNDSSIISLLLCLLFNTFLFDVYILGYNSKDMISLYNGDKEIKIEVKDESYSYEAIMGEDTLTLYFSHPGYIEIPVGSWCDFYGKRYSLKKDSNFKKNGERNFEYTLILETGKADTMLWKVRHTVDRSIKFSYTAKAHEHLRLLVENLNRRSTGWKVGDCIEGAEKVINYNHTYILDALNQLAELYETEWQITEETVNGKQIKTIHLRKVEYNKENPLKLSYGKGHGFKVGVGRTSGDIPPEIILVETTDRNIDYSTYGSKYLLLPKNKTLVYEGRTYKTDADGTCVMRADKELTTAKEESLDCTAIYPSRVGTVSSVIEVNKENNFFDFVDKDIPEELNFEDCLIAGETMTVIFQTGMLTGKEFEVKYIHEAKDKKEARRFEIVPQEIDGITMPEPEVWRPKVGDTYAVFGIQLPKAYICNDSTQTGASWEAFKEAAKYLYEHEDKAFIFTGTLDGIWAKKRWLEIGGKIVLGGYVDFYDTQFHPEGSLIRMIGIKRFVNNPYSPEIELSNEPIGTSVSSDLNKIETNEVTVIEKHKDALQFTKRRFRDAQETMSMLEDALLNFSGSVNPITVSTMQLLVGDESLQFRFVNSKTNPVQESHNITFNTSTKILNAPAGIIQHLTLGISSLSSSHKADEYKYWDMAEYNSPALIDPKKKYYLYAKVGKENQAGTFLLSETAIKMEQIAGYYHLLTGVLNSEYEGSRSFVSLYGFTEVLPGRIATDMVVSSDGLNFIDFVNNSFRVGNNEQFIDFNSKGDGKLRLKGSIIQSGSGEESYIGCFRGVYNNLYTYYEGDEVTYDDGNGASSYKFISKTPSKDIVPTNKSYWIIIASHGNKGDKGDDGTNGDHIEYVYMTKATQPTTPSGSDIPPYGWSSVPTSPNNTMHVWMSQVKVSGAGVVGEWSTPIRISGINGKDGADGTDVEFIYKQTTISTPPTKPETSQEVDYVPLGWSDNPQGVNSTYLYEWICVRYKIAGVWGEFSSPVVWSKWGEKGMDGDGYEYIYKRTTASTSPSRPTEISQTDDFIPDGWVDDPRGVTSTYIYEWVCVRKKTNGVWEGFSSPAVWAKFGQDGNDGSDGAYFEYRYAKNGSNTTPPELLNTSDIPNGWDTVIPALSTLEYLWCTIAKKSANGTLLQKWSVPLRVNGVDGGKGDKGEPGDKGESPATVFRGVYSDSNTYYGTKYRLDVVKYNDVYYVTRIDAGVFFGKTPTDTSKWNTFGAQFDSVATQLLLAEYANLGGLIFKNEKLISQTGYIGNAPSDEFENDNFAPNIEIDGKNGGIYLNGFFASRFSTSYETTKDKYPKTMNFIVKDNTSLDFVLPNSEMYIGSILTVYLDKNITIGGGVRIGSASDYGIVSYKGNGISLFVKNKGTIVRLMATRFESNRLQWELINFDSKHFSFVDVAGGGVMLDRSVVSSERSFSDLPSLFNYWNTI